MTVSPEPVSGFDQQYQALKVAAVAEAKAFKKQMKAGKSDISPGQVRALCEKHFTSADVSRLFEEFVAEVNAAL